MVVIPLFQILNSETMKSIFLMLLLITFSIQINAQWQLKGNKLEGVNFDDRFGEKVSMNNEGSRVAIGSRLNDSIGSDAGSVLVYEFMDSLWVQLGSQINGEAANDWFGWNLELSESGNRLIVGGSRNDDNGIDAGHVRVFEFVNNDWTQLGNDINGDVADDRFGRAVGISNNGQRIIVGAPNNDNLSNNAGLAKVFEYDGNNWIQVGSDILGESIADRSGSSVSINEDGDIIAIGAIENNGVAGGNSGHIRVFQFDGNDWIQLGNDIDGEVHGDRFGVSVDLSDSGLRVIGGANQNDDAGFHAGHARVFEYNNGSWVQLGSDIDGTEERKECGFDVEMSGDGNRIIVGSPSAANAVADARVFQYFGTDWTQIGSTIESEVLGDHVGASVSLSYEGNVIAVGAPINSHGATRLFEYGYCNSDSNSVNVIIDGQLKVSQMELTNCDYPEVVIKPDGTLVQKNPIPNTLVLPKYTTVERDSLINVQLGAMIYNITTDCNEVYRVNGWFNLCTNQYE